jgi:hypothetical protein
MRSADMDVHCTIPRRMCRVQCAMNNAQCRCAGLRKTYCTDSVLRPVCSAGTDAQHPGFVHMDSAASSAASSHMYICTVHIDERGRG